MLGWVAATGKFGIEAGVLFMLQFFWQFPHFWAIGWFYMKTIRKQALICYQQENATKALHFKPLYIPFGRVLISNVPVFGFTGRLQLSVVAMILTLAAGFWFLYYGFRLFKNQTDKAARQLMLSSVVYITLIQIIYVSDKFIRLWI